MVCWLWATQLGHLWLPTPHCVVPAWLTGHHVTPFVTYRTLCHTIGHQLLHIQLCYHRCCRFERAFFYSQAFFYFTLLPAFFKASPGASSSTSRLAGLHADLWNIVPAQLFAWITASFIQVGSIQGLGLASHETLIFVEN